MRSSVDGAPYASALGSIPSASMRRENQELDSSDVMQKRWISQRRARINVAEIVVVCRSLGQEGGD